MPVFSWSILSISSEYSMFRPHENCRVYWEFFALIIRFLHICGASQMRSVPGASKFSQFCLTFCFILFPRRGWARHDGEREVSEAGIAAAAEPVPGGGGGGAVAVAARRAGPDRAAAGRAPPARPPAHVVGERPHRRAAVVAGRPARRARGAGAAARPPRPPQVVQRLLHAVLRRCLRRRGWHVRQCVRWNEGKRWRRTAGWFLGCRTGVLPGTKLVWAAARAGGPAMGFETDAPTRWWWWRRHAGADEWWPSWSTKRIWWSWAWFFAEWGGQERPWRFSSWSEDGSREERGCTPKALPIGGRHQAS